MAMDMFLDLGKIAGESVDKTHAGKIDVLAWSWGMSQSGTFHTASGGGAGKANFQDISFTKYIDKASCALMSCVATGEHIPKAKLIVRKAGGSGPLEYFLLTMEKCLVSSYSTGGSGGEDRLTENVSLNFAKFEIEYLVQKEDGTGEKAGNLSFDIAANAL
jgi:type VI secretion system secreted protein Hcp